MDVMSVVNLYTAIQTDRAQIANQVGLLRIAIDSQAQSAKNLIEGLTAAPINPAHLGNNIDIYL